MSPNYGQLYICATPIGNLKDITLRVLEKLKEVDLVVAEDTRTAKKLLTHYNIHKPLFSFYKDNERRALPKIISLLKSGQTIAQISEAGMPGIADPGHTLVKACLKEGIKFTVLPGPSALLTAVALSGLPTTDIRFLGFIPKKRSAKEKFFHTLKYQPSTLVFFETALRLTETLELAAKVFGQRQAFIGRELTKKFEQHLRGTISQIAAEIKETVLKGELVLVIQGAATVPPPSKRELKALIKLELEKGGSAADIIKLISESFGLPKKQVYEVYLELKTKSQEFKQNL